MHGNEQLYNEILTINKCNNVLHNMVRDTTCGFQFDNIISVINFTGN